MEAVEYVDNAIKHQIYENVEVLLKKPDCIFKRNLFGAERLEEVRIKSDSDSGGKIIKFSLSYGFGRQVSADWTEDDGNKVYNFLVENGWKVATSMTVKCGLSPKEVITVGCAFKKAYYAAYDKTLPIDEFIAEVIKEYKINKKEYESDYANVVDLDNLRAALMGDGSGEKGLGFKSLNDF